MFYKLQKTFFEAWAWAWAAKFKGKKGAFFALKNIKFWEKAKCFGSL